VPTLEGTPVAKITFSPPPAAAPAPPPLAVAPPASPPPESVFALGADFADLQSQLGSLLGVPIEDEHIDEATEDGCDQVQRTSTGLVYLRCTTGLETFVADPDGAYHWAWLGDHLAAWIGPQVDPPDVALSTTLPVCVGPATGPSSACPLRSDLPVAGVLHAPGDTDTYAFNLASDLPDVSIDLTDLPADYDLYLADSTGNVVAQSVQEGTQPEHIEQPLPAGTYYLYVHADPGRDADPSQPYTVKLSNPG
jgi:hypothetical protein